MARDNYRIIGVCPNCSSWRLVFRKLPDAPWGCSDCRVAFRTPGRVRFNVQNHPERYFLAEDVVRLEESLRDAPSSYRKRENPAIGGGLNFPEFGLTGFSPKGCLIVVVIVAVAVLVCSLAVNRNGDDDSDVAQQNAPSQTQAVPAAELPPAQRHYEYKAYMLELINAERAKAGVPPVAMGNNFAAQLHAENALQGCFSSHWGLDGLKPYMRYSLAGGYQTNGENGSGSDYCITASDRYRALDTIKEEIQETMAGWMDSPGHRRNILDKWHKKVSIGLAWDKYNFAAYQHFEGDYVEFDELPEITDGTLFISGRAINGLRFSGKEELGLQIFYDPPPHSLTRGQVSRTYCYDSGLWIAAFRYPLTGNRFWHEDQFTKRYSPCPDPYGVPLDAPAPRSPDEAHEFWEEAYAASQNREELTITGPWITASNWIARGAEFSVTTDISELLSKYGPGVYTILLWGELGGEDVPVSQYSIFYEVEPPGTYSPDPWK